MAEPMKANGACPSLETIGAFVDGRFKDRERDVIAEHLASCETCYFVFTESARLIAESRPKADTNYGWRRMAVAGLAAAATIVIAVNVWGTFGNADRRALDQLVTAVGTARTFDPRLTGGFAYAPVRGVVRGSNDTPQLSPDVRIAIAEIEKQNAAGPVAASAALIGGDANRAIDILEAASKNTLDDARIFSDLSAAYLVRASQRANNTGDLQSALTNTNRALEINRSMPEALFNRALTLQMLGQTVDAQTAWQSFLTVDGASGWADEARLRLRILSNQP
jgi:tetratricopeptide (TPR) repeat protein